MTLEMANGTDFGQCNLVFELRDGWAKVSRKQVADLPVVGSPPDLFVVQNHVSRQLRYDPHWFYLTGDLPRPLPTTSPTRLPLVCHQLWDLFLQRVRGAGHIVIGVWHREAKYMDCRQQSAPVTLGLFDVVPPLFGWPGEFLSQPKVLEIASSLVAGVTELSMDLRPQLWKNLLGVFPPHMMAREARERYFSLLVSCAGRLKQRWLAKYHDEDPQTLQLYGAIQRDAERTDPGEEFFASQGGVSPTGLDNVSCLTNVVMTYCEEHREVAYTQGMTDLVAPILYVLQQSARQQTEVEGQVYVMYSAMMEGLKANFSRNCRGALERVECVRHLCEVMDPTLYRRLSGFEDDAFALCFGMVLIDARREFPFRDGMRLMEVVWSSRCSERTVVAAAEEDWPTFMTSQSNDLLLSHLRGEDPPSDRLSSTSLNSDVPHSAPQKCYSERPAVGYSVTPLPSDDNGGVVNSLLESGRVTPYRPFDDEDVRSQASSLPPSLDASMENPQMTTSVQSELPLIGAMDVQVSVSSSYTVFIVVAIFIALRKQILSQGRDFVSFSVTLKNSQNIVNLEQVLCVARQLEAQYTTYQRMLYEPQASRWLHLFRE